MEKIGKVLRVTNAGGLCILVEEGPQGKESGFSFGVIEGYGGEYARELTMFSSRGLVEGVLVKFEQDSQGRITCVRPLMFLQRGTPVTYDA